MLSSKIFRKAIGGSKHTPEKAEDLDALRKRHRALINDSQLFDAAWYRIQDACPAEEFTDAIDHYLDKGAAIGLDPHPLFHTNYYLKQNPDVATSGQNALVHYLEKGGLEKRNPCPLFDSEWYRWSNPDVAKTRINPLVHYVKYGASEGRSPHQDINVEDYMADHPHVRGLNPLIHYYTERKEERDRESQPKSDTETDRPKLAFPLGHYYSPVINTSELNEHLSRADIFSNPMPTLAGIELNTTNQLALLTHLREYGQTVPFPDTAQDGFRYYFENDFFSYGDGTVLHAMMRDLKPKRVIEIGSGFSSAVMLDTNERYLNSKVDFTFIEPYPERLLSLLKQEDLDKATLIKDKVQRCNPAIFQELEKNDILFVDSSHVSKTGGDLNYILFEALPMVQPGVVVHFHDIFYPFEYPIDWLKDGRGWNESYFLRAFLTNNRGYEILLFNSFLRNFHETEFLQFSPKCHRSFGSIWLRKLS